MVLHKAKMQNIVDLEVSRKQTLQPMNWEEQRMSTKEKVKIIQLVLQKQN